MGEKSKLKINLQIILIVLFFSALVIFTTTPIHEATHWIIAEIDPYSEPIEFHLFDEKSFHNGQNVLDFNLGSVVVRESYPGSFDDRPKWIDPFQELICLSIQLLITYFIVTKIIKIWMNKKLIMTRPI